MTSEQIAEIVDAATELIGDACAVITYAVAGDQDKVKKTSERAKQQACDVLDLVCEIVDPKPTPGP